MTTLTKTEVETVRAGGTISRVQLNALCDMALAADAAFAAMTERAEKAEAALRVVQNAAKALASAQGSELEHLRQNAKFDHALRSEVESLRQHNSDMTEATEAITEKLALATGALEIITLHAPSLDVRGIREYCDEALAKINATAEDNTNV